MHSFLAALPTMKIQAVFSSTTAPRAASAAAPAPAAAVASPSTERIKQLSDRLDNLRGELVSERSKSKVCAALPRAPVVVDLSAYAKFRPSAVLCTG